MYELLDDTNGCILQFDCIPHICSEIQIEFGKIAFSIIIPIQEGCTDQVLNAACDVYAVTVPDALRKASEIPYLMLLRTFEFRWYALAYTSVYKGRIWNVIYACRCLLRIAWIRGQPTIYAYEACERLNRIYNVSAVQLANQFITGRNQTWYSKILGSYLIDPGHEPEV